MRFVELKRKTCPSVIYVTSMTKGLVALALAALAAPVLTACVSGASPTPERTVTVLVSTAPSAALSGEAGPERLGRIAVGGSEGRRAPMSVQAFADDVADGSLDRIVRQCWTLTPERIRAALDLPGRVAVLATLSTPMRGAQSGWHWGSGLTQLSFTDSETNSPYACPSLGSATVTARDAELLLTRLAKRHAGTPFRSKDLEINYQLICEFQNSLGPTGSRADAEAGIDAAVWPVITVLGSQSLTATSLVPGGFRFAPTGSQAPTAEVVLGPAGFCLQSVRS